MLKRVLCLILIAACGHPQAQTFNEFKAQCVADQRAACAAGKWWRGGPYLLTTLVGGSPNYFENSVIVTSMDTFARLVCGTGAASLSEVSQFFAVVPHPEVAIALVGAAAKIEGDCSAHARQMVLLQQQLDVLKENQQLLKGDIQAILGKLMPGATVTITVPKPPAAPASAP